VLLRLRLGAAAFGVRVPVFRVGVAPLLLARPTLMAALGLDFLPDNRVVLCADKGVAPPVGRAKDFQQLGLDGIDVLESLFQGVLVFVSRPHDSHHSSSARLGITGLRQQRTSRDPLSFTSTRTGPGSVHFDGCTRERPEPGGEAMAVACRRNLDVDGGHRTLTVVGKGDRQHLACT
jgi:hypothetical protein